jgi:hypothetical protein
VGVIGAVVAVAVFPSTAFGADYVAYVGCSPFASAAPSHVCEVGDEPGAFFESPEAEVEYEACVTFPTADVLCAEEQPAEEGVLYVNTITSELPGDYLVNWYVEDIEVAEWAFRMDEPLPPPPPVIPVVTSPSAPVVGTSPGPSQACLKAGRRVLRLQAQLKVVKALKAKKTLRKHLHGARVTKKAAC